MENCAIKIIKKLSCCITGKSIRSTSQPQQQRPQQQQAPVQLQGLPAQQQPQAKQLLPPQQTSASRDTQPRPGAQSGTTTLKIKRLLVLPPTTTTTEKDIVDYASASRNSVSVVSDHQEKERRKKAKKCIDNNYGDEMVRVPNEQLKSDSSRCGSAMNVDDRDRVIGEDRLVERSCVIDAHRNTSASTTTTTVDKMKQPETNKDIDHRSDIDRSFAVVNGGEDEDEDPYAELDMYLEKVKVCRI